MEEGLEEEIKIPTFDILYQDDYFVAICKPHDILVHRTKLSQDTVFVLQSLSKQVGMYLYPIHRLDRKTSGVLLFAFTSEVAKNIHEQFQTSQITKTYLAICRGHLPQLEMTIDYPLTNDRGKTQDAITILKVLKQSEIDIPLGKFQTSRYSLLKVKPLTGRFHQIRKHLKHIFHPIVGDRPHGCNKQNRLFKEKWDMHTMLLHAQQIQLHHPETDDLMIINTPPLDEFQRMLGVLELA